jgi:biotin synthase
VAIGSERFVAFPVVERTVEALPANEAVRLIRSAPGPALDSLLDRAWQARQAVCGTEVGLCAIVNARSGGCSEDCSFCAQSGRVKGAASVPRGKLSAREIAAAAVQAEEAGACAFSIVAAGRSLSDEKGLRAAEEALAHIGAATRVLRCASLGLLDKASLRRLRRAGLQRYHHNLETARSFFPRICTTHTFEQKVDTIRAARSAGLSVCSGGIFGLGETPDQRVELAEALRLLDVDAVPINFLDPRPGTPLENVAVLRPEECLATIAVFRLMLPRAEIIVMGGRDAQIGPMRHRIFRAGATGTITGDYLTTRGCTSETVLEMIRAEGLRLRLSGGRTS